MSAPKDTVISKIKWQWKNLMTRRLDRDTLHDFWQNPTKKNQPLCYAEGDSGLLRSGFLYATIKDYVNPEHAVLEIGCNVGRNLNLLYEQEYRNLAGLEINQGALNLMKEVYPNLARVGQFLNASMEDGIKSFPDNTFDLVFTMAVLEHLHKDSEFVFGEIARITKKYLFVLEDEIAISKRHFPRKYRNIFESLGFKQIHEAVYKEDCPVKHVLQGRLFLKG